MNKQERLASISRAKDLVLAGAQLAEAARACSLSTDVLKRISAREGWVKARTAANPAPLSLPRHASAETLAQKAAGLIEEALATGRAVRPESLIAIEQWARERERDTAPAFDFSGVPNHLLADLERALLAIEGVQPGDPSHPDTRYAHDPASVREERDALRARVAAIGDATELDALIAQRDDARAALAEVRVERDALALRVRARAIIATGTD